MFKHIKRVAARFANVIMQPKSIPTQLYQPEQPGQPEQPEPNQLYQPGQPEQPEQLDPNQLYQPEQPEQPEQKQVLITPLTLADHVFKYEPCEITAIQQWKAAEKPDIGRLIAIIGQLYFFLECSKRCMRSYELHKDDIPKYIAKIRRRPYLNIKTAHIDVDDPTAMFYMYRRLKTMIGMFHINDFMVRIEHAFDNSQIVAEHLVVQRLLVLARTGACAGIDTEHHIVLPVCVQLCNIGKIPEPVRTMFHHISYSIQPVVAQSHTMDTWFRRYKPSTALIAKLCGQMAIALNYLHTHDIVHGDIKPTNTLVCVSNDDKHSDDDKHSNDKHSDSDDSNSSNSNNSSNSSSSNSNSNGNSSNSNSSNSNSSNSIKGTGTSNDLVLYVIDYGMSGLHNEGDGTGGTKPFCAPETGNGCNSAADMDTYKWVSIRKEHDMWSFALMFFTMVTLRKCVFYKKDYPAGFFDANGHVSASYIDAVAHEPLRSLFRRTLCPAETRLTAREFLDEINQINQD